MNVHTLGAGEAPPSQPPSLVQRPPPISQGDSPYHYPPTPLHSHPTVSSPASQGEERPCLSHACGHPTSVLAAAKNPHHPRSGPLSLPVPKATTSKQRGLRKRLVYNQATSPPPWDDENPRLTPSIFWREPTPIFFPGGPGKRGQHPQGTLSPALPHHSPGVSSFPPASHSFIPCSMNVRGALASHRTWDAVTPSLPRGPHSAQGWEDACVMSIPCEDRCAPDPLPQSVRPLSP